MMMLEIIVFVLFFFSIGGLVYEASGLFNRFYHDVLNWHRPGPNTPIKMEGTHLTSRCEFCGKRITEDDRGHWW